MAFRTLLVCLLLLFVNGCVRYAETIVVDQDGKGTAEIVLSRPTWDESADPLNKVAGIVEKSFGETAMAKALPPGLTCDYRRAASDGKIAVHALYRYDDIATLIGWAAQADSPLGNISVLRKGGSLEYSRAFGLLRQNEMAELRPYFPQCQLVFKLTGPGTLEVTNAARRDGNTAVWELKASDLFAGQSFTARYCYAGRWTWVWYFLAGLLAGAVLRILYRRLTGKNHEIRIAAPGAPQPKG